MEIIEKKIKFEIPDLINLLGSNDVYLHLIENRFNTTIIVRGENIILKGNPEEIKAIEKNINIELNCDDNIKALINAPLLEQALINLLDNAVKYSGPGSSIQVNAAEAGQDVVISVIDHGCGIEREHLPRLFERFYRVDKARSRKLGGTGLGLSIVKHIVVAHNGRVEVESVPGKGSTFSIFLPIP